MARVIVVPGLAVRAYVASPVQHLRHRYDATLLQPPAWRGVDQDLELYGRHLAADIDNDGVPVDVLIGLSAGSQAATVAASLTSLVSRLVLVSPTVDPAYRSMIKQLYVFARGDPHDKSAFYHHVPDWARAGIPRIFRGFASAITLHVEDILPEVAAEIDEALRVAPDHPEARRLLGDVKLKQGDYMGALEAYNRAVELARG